VLRTVCSGALAAHIQETVSEEHHILTARSSSHVRVGIGDDAAVLDDGTVVSVDAAVEDVHFRRAWLSQVSYRDIARRAALAALSDLWAMGAYATAVAASWTIPPDLNDETIVSQLARGTEDAVWPTGALVVGGNLSRGATLTLTTTVLGRLHAEPILRSGARPGDRIWVSGTLGASGLALELLERNLRAGEVLSEMFDRGTRHDVSARIAGLATAAIDISDGLSLDLRRLSAVSKIRAVVEERLIPVHEATRRQARASGIPIDVWTSGEEYEVLFTAPPESDFSDVATAIGRMEKGSGVFAERDGRLEPITAAGFDHFER
jgi:thiamine-monophosphate kinase